MCKLAPSILSADFNRLGEQIKILEDNQIELLHIDVMDGAFVPSISFGMPLIASIRKESRLFFDVHLMVQEPARYLKEFVDCGADSITVHVEACKDPLDTLRQLKQYPVKSAVSINPSTPVPEVVPFLEQADMVLVMGVEPGFGGQKLIPSTLDKLRELDDIRQQKGYGYLLEIDGGVNRSNIQQITTTGADIIVAGTAVFGGDIKKNIHQLKEDIAGAS
jgi:ribulose-phosphate 3-epimerase